MGIIFFNFIVDLMSAVVKAFVHSYGLRVFKNKHKKIKGKLGGFHAVSKIQKLSERGRETGRQTD